MNNQEKIKAAEKRKKELQLLIDCWRKKEQVTKKMKSHNHLKCPNCGAYTKQKVVTSKKNSEKITIRRRYCFGCEHRWYTLQYPEFSVKNITAYRSLKN